MTEAVSQEMADAMEVSHLSPASSDHAEEPHGIASGPSRDAQRRRSSLEYRRLPPPLSPRVAQDGAGAIEGSAIGPFSGSPSEILKPLNVEASLRRSGPGDISRAASGGVMLRRCSTESARSLDFDSEVSEDSRRSRAEALRSSRLLDRCSPRRSAPALPPSLHEHQSGHRYKVLGYAITRLKRAPRSPGR